ncbi:MAG: N-acetylneuraminate synthase family protein [Campylobacterota bacterium]|nr:N-acetylneuraminate synthase family protein [Campylobacterota bacterium]
MSLFIIAEIGINHNGDINIAKEMILKAKEAGADCVKFQTFKAEEFVSDSKQTYRYQSQGKYIIESMLEMFKRHEFNQQEWKDIVLFCKQHNIVFSSTAQNISDLEFLLSITDLPFIKVGSDDLTNLEQMRYYASKKIPMIISAGMAYAYEIEDAVKTIKDSGNDNITVLHCISSYPTQSEDVNLRKIPVIKDAFNVDVGFSDHTIGSTAAIGSVCMGAKIIEKHFTLDNNMSGPDHWFSINPIELKKYIDDIRFIKNALGKAELKPTDKEIEMRKTVQRKIVAKNTIVKGELITKNNIDYKRVDNIDNNGIDPKNFLFIENRTAKKDIQKNETITLEILQ